MQKLFRRVLVPYDFSRHATRALVLGAELARADGGRVVVLHVIPVLSSLVGVPPGEFPPAVATRELAAEQERRLRARVARELGRRDGPPVSCLVVVGEPFQEIVSHARAASAVVMGTLGLTGLSHLLIGSVAEKVVRHAPVPVLTVRAAIRTTARAERPRRAGRAAGSRGRTGTG